MTTTQLPQVGVLMLRLPRALLVWGASAGGRPLAHLRNLAVAAIAAIVVSSPAVRADDVVPRVWIDLSSAAGAPGEDVTLDVSLHTGGEAVAGVQTDIGFDPAALSPPQTDNGRPLCFVNPNINKVTSFAFQPPACVVGGSCTAFRAIVFAFDNVDPIPDGALLFTCTVRIAPNTPPGTYTLSTSHRRVSDPTGVGNDIPGSDGEVVVTLVPGATPNATWTSAPSRTPTPTRLPTATFNPTGLILDRTPRPLASDRFVDAQCESRHCVDSFCCDVAICPADTLCNILGHEGTCFSPPRQVGSEGPTPTPQANGGIVEVPVPRRPGEVGSGPTIPAESGCTIAAVGRAHATTLWMLLLPLALLRLRGRDLAAVGLHRRRRPRAGVHEGWTLCPERGRLDSISRPKREGGL